jgi:C4-dicarboxylate-specific signal transduction histidine kinase
MEGPAELPAEEVRRLQRCINDLISVLAFPAVWAGRTPSQIVSFFVDGLTRILHLDAAYIRLTDEDGCLAHLLRVPGATEDELASASAVFAALCEEPTEWPRQVVIAPGQPAICIEPLRVGLHPGSDLLVAGSRRSGFPLLTEKLLLNVAANQLLLGLQESQSRLKQQRLTEELDARVAQRTAEIAAANAELRKEIEDRRRAEEQRRLSEGDLSAARTELANSARFTSLAMLTASIAHEINQPLSGIMTNASICLRMLSAEPPNLEGALETARRTIRDGNRASNVITRLRTLYSRKDVQPEPMDLNEATREVASLLLDELQRNRVMLRYELADSLPCVKGDRIQLQQVILNLLRNAADSMSAIEDRPREALIRTELDTAGGVCLRVSDTGVGFSEQGATRIFEPFYTTKSDGMGIGLFVSRSIIEAHSGNLWATPNEGPGVTFNFTVPPHSV